MKILSETLRTRLRILCGLIVVSGGGLLLNACTLPGNVQSSSSAAGAQVWVEYPFEEQILPNEAVTFVVYATSAESISGINVKVNGEVLPAAQIVLLDSDSSVQMFRLDQIWIPVVEGEHVLEAASVAADGVELATSLTRFCIVSCGPDDPRTMVSPPAADPTATPTPDGTSTEEITPEIVVDFYASPSAVDAGACFTLYWSVDGTELVYLDDGAVIASGSREICPCETETHNLLVVDELGSELEYTLQVDVYGTCNGDPPPDDPATEEPPPPADTTGPTVHSVSTFWDGCTIYGLSTISDPSGVNHAEFWYNQDEVGWAWILMNQNGDEWVSQVGIDTEGFAGSLDYKVRTLDSLYNETWSGVFTHNYSYCGE